jgi:Zn-dependent protease
VSLFHLMLWLRMAPPAQRWLLSAASLAVFAGIYGLRGGAAYAAGVALMFCIHEAGHLLAACWRRVPADPPVFLPFVGAFILTHPEAAPDGRPDDEAFIALGGPALGTAGAWACWAAGEALGSPQLVQAAWLGMVLNLFNLIPLAPLDGGQIAQAVSEPLMWSVGLHALAVLVFWLPPQALAVMALVVGPLMAARFWMGDAASAATAPPVLRPGLRWAYGLGYLGLLGAAALGVGLLSR